MKILYIQMLALLLSIQAFSQEVTTLTNVAANGGVSIDQAGNLYVAHFGPLPIAAATIGKNIYKITPNGTVTLFVQGELNVGSGNNIDSDGFLYQSNLITNLVYKIDTAGNVVDNAFASVAGPVGIASDSINNLYVCSCNTNAVRKISPNGTNTVFASGSAFNCANGITMDDEGFIYTTNFSDGRVTKIAKDGSTTTIGSTPVGNGHLAFRSADQSLYIASYSGHRIYKMDLSGNVEVFAGTGIPGTLDSADLLSTQFLRPNGIAFSNNDCMLYVTQDDNVIRAILFDDSDCSTTLNTKLFSPKKISIYPNPTNDKIYFDTVSNKRFSSIQIIGLDGKTIETHRIRKENFFDISHLRSGIYSILLTSEDGTVFRNKIVVQ